MEQTITYLPQSSEVEYRLGEQEQKLKTYYTNNSQKSNNTGVSHRDLLTFSVRLLEVYVVIALTTESASALQIKTLGELIAQAKPIAESVIARSQLDLRRVTNENKELFEEASLNGKSPDEPIKVSVHALLQRVSAFLPLIHIQGLEEDSKLSNNDLLGQRCASAYRQLEEFVSRHQPRLEKAIKALGPAYQEGRLSIQEIGETLGLQAWDVVPELERHGFFRSLTTNELPPERRQRILTKLREERLARHEKTTINENVTIRNVLASQRIEDVDVRLWLIPKP
jgi:predicted component of type VI protein secretion system